MKEHKQRKKENKNTLIKLLENEWKQVTKIVEKKRTHTGLREFIIVDHKK